MPAYKQKYAGNYKNQYEHILLVEKVLGRKLPEGAEVHHFDGNRTNNKHSNLIVCQDHAYHMLLHRRARAYKACGHADWLKCFFCKTWDDTINLNVTENSKSGVKSYHQDCRRKHDRRWHRVNRMGWLPELADTDEKFRKGKKDVWNTRRGTNDFSPRHI